MSHLHLPHLYAGKHMHELIQTLKEYGEVQKWAEVVQNKSYTSGRNELDSMKVSEVLDTMEALDLVDTEEIADLLLQEADLLDLGTQDLKTAFLMHGSKEIGKSFFLKHKYKISYIIQ